MTGPAPLRVTVVAAAGVLGGAELWLLRLLAATDRLAVDAVLLAAGPPAAELARLGIPVRLLPAGRRPGELAGAVARLAALLRRDGRPDLVLANGVKAAVLAAPAARLAAVRCVWVKHDHSYDGPVNAVLARLVDGVVAASPSLAAASRRPDAVVVPPPRPPRPLSRDLARLMLATLGLDPADPRPVLAVVGRLVRYKGVEDAVLALARPGGREWRLLVVGVPDPAEPGEPERLRRLAATAGVADRVVFAGPVAEAAGLLPGVDAVAVLTKPTGAGPGQEGFATVALEAGVAGVPVIATGPGTVADRLNGGAGVVVPPGSPARVAAALGRLADPAVRARQGAAGRALTAGHPDAAGCADLLARELARVAGRPGAGLSVSGPPVSVVVTVLDEAGTVDALLAALAGQLAHARDEVVVVDGGSRDGTADRVRAWSRRDDRIRLLSRPGAGISAGRNAGVRAAGNDLIACTDAGCTPDPGWLAAFRAAAADGAPPGLLTGVYRVPGRGPAQLALAAVGYPDPAELRRPSLLVRGYGRLFGRTVDPAMPTGRSMAFPAAVWAAAGGFPEHLQTGEDVLFGRAAARAGPRPVLVADAAVSWAQRPTVAATARMYFRYGQGSGRSADPRLLGRDLARLAGYAVAPWLLARARRPARAAALAAGAAYLSLPAARLLRPRAAPDLASGAGPAPVHRHRPGASPAASAGPGRSTRVLALAALPAAAALRDLAKAAGAVHGLATRHRRAAGTGSGAAPAGAPPREVGPVPIGAAPVARGWVGWRW